jgi:abequosyltransferase
MYRPLLSICIPTFNRQYYLENLLVRLRDEAVDDTIQIVVSDNCSNDNTEELCRRFRATLPLKYVRQNTNTGRQNLVNVFQYADGIYGALIGDDDAFRPGWVRYLCTLLENHSPDIVLSDRIVCDQNLNPISLEVCGPVTSSPKIYWGGDRNSVLKYFNETHTACGFGFISNMVAKKSLWLNVKDTNTTYQNDFPHTIKIIDIFYRQCGRLLRVPLGTVLARTANERFEPTGTPSEIEFGKRNQHIQGFLEVADMYFSNDEEMRKAFLRPIYLILSPSFISEYLRCANAANKLPQAELVLRRLGLN